MSSCPQCSAQDQAAQPVTAFPGHQAAAPTAQVHVAEADASWDQYQGNVGGPSTPPDVDPSPSPEGPTLRQDMASRMGITDRDLNFVDLVWCKLSKRLSL